MAKCWSAILWLILLLALACACSAGTAANFLPDRASLQGQWEEVVIREGRDVPYSVLTLELQVQGDEVHGRYCFVTRFGKKADCDPQSGDNLEGTMTSASTAAVTFDTSFGAVEGKASLRLEGDVLHWELMQSPSGGQFFGPETAKLHRTSKNR